MKTGKQILESCLEILTNQQKAIISDLTEEMFVKGLTRMDLPLDFGKPTDSTKEYVKTLGLAIYSAKYPATISLPITDIDKLGKFT